MLLGKRASRPLGFLIAVLLILSLWALLRDGADRAQRLLHPYLEGAGPGEYDDFAGSAPREESTPATPTPSGREGTGGQGRATLTINCIDEDKRPIESVAVFADFGGRAEPLGASDQSGQLVIQAPVMSERGAFLVIGSLEGYTTAQRTCGAIASQDIEVVLTLRPATILRGRVLVPEGEDPSGIAILAVPKSLDDKLRSKPLSSWVSDPRVVMAASDADGAFRLSGVSTSLEYRVRAGGKGLVSNEFAKTVFFDDYVEISLFYAYGALVRFQSSDGSSARIADCVGLDGGIRDVLPGNKAFSYLASYDAAIVLAGLDEALLPTSLGSRLYCFVSRAPFAAVGPLQILAKYPGYTELDATVVIPRVIPGIDNIIDIPLVPERVNWGKLRLMFPDVSGKDRAVERSLVAPFGYVDLVNVLEQKARYVIEALNDNGEYEVMVPCGEYRLIFVPSPWQYLPDAGSSAVKEHLVSMRSDGVSISISTSHTGSVLFAPFDSSGLPYVERLAIFVSPELVQPDPQGGIELVGRSAAFRWAEYCVPFLMPGDYTFVLAEPHIAEPVWGHFVVRAGTTTDVSFVIPDSPK